MEVFDRSGHSRHLSKGNRSFLHSSTACGCYSDDRGAPSPGVLERAHDLLPGGRTHSPAHEGEVEEDADDSPASQHSFSRNHRLSAARLAFRQGEAQRVARRVGKGEWIGRVKISIPLEECCGVEKLGDPIFGGEYGVTPTGRANAKPI
jgi:hypothetical protein